MKLLHILPLLLLSSTGLAEAQPPSDIMAIWQHAYQQDFQLKDARLAHQGEKARLRQTQALVYPSVESTIQWSHTDQEPEHKNLSLSVNQALYHPETRSQLRLSRTQLEQTALTISRTEQQLMIRLSEQYVAVLEARNHLDALASEQRSSRQQRDLALAQQKLGLGDATDVAEAQARYDQLQAQQIWAQNRVDNARDTLETTIGQPIGQLQSLRKDSNFIHPPQHDIKHWQTLAKQHNLPLNALKNQSRQAAYRLQQARSRHWPALSLRLQQQHNDPALLGQSQQTQVGITAKMSLYQGGRTQAQIKEARLQQQRAHNLINQSTALLTQSIRQHWRNLHATQQEVNALEQALMSAQASKDRVSAGFRVGSRSNLDALNAEQRLAQSHENLQAAKHRYVLSWLLLRESSGVLSVTHLQTVAGWMK